MLKIDGSGASIASLALVVPSNPIIRTANASLRLSASVRSLIMALYDACAAFVLDESIRIAAAEEGFVVQPQISRSESTAVDKDLNI